MPELVILSLERKALLRAHKDAAREGEAGQAALVADLWADHVGKAIACFLCDSECASPPFSMIVEDRDDSIMALPLCGGCAGLPQLVRLHRCQQLLRKMWNLERRSKRRRAR
jgi:hypothetical protein